MLLHLYRDISLYNKYIQFIYIYIFIIYLLYSISDKTQEARRILLSDINFTSMVPELSRSADHLCRGGDNSNIRNEMNGINLTEYYKGTTLKTPDCISRGYI